MALFGWQPPRARVAPSAPSGFGTQGPLGTPAPISISTAGMTEAEKVAAATKAAAGARAPGVSGDISAPWQGAVMRPSYTPPPAPRPAFGGIGWGQLRPEYQAAVGSAYQAAPAARQGQAFQAFGRAGLNPALSTLGVASPEWGNLTPEAQRQLIAAYQQLDPTRQAAARAAFEQGNVAGLTPWLSPAPTGLQLQYEQLNPEAQASLQTAYGALTPAQQAAALSTANAQGLSATLPMLGAAPIAYEQLTPQAQQLALERYNALPEGMQDMVRAQVEKGGIQAAMPLLAMDPNTVRAEDLYPYMTFSSRRMKRDVKTLRDILPGGRQAHIPSPAAGGLANALGELHGAVRGLAKDVAGLKKARGGR